jgi:hypothetical protein
MIYISQQLSIVYLKAEFCQLIKFRDEELPTFLISKNEGVYGGFEEVSFRLLFANGYE